MKFPDWLDVYGDLTYRNKDCPSEVVEQITFVARIRAAYPQTYGRCIVHVRNEGQRSIRQAMRHKAEGLTSGAADIIIPGGPAFVCELKRRDHTTSRWQDGQLDYLEAAQKSGAFVCIALGADAAWQAFEAWRTENGKQTKGKT